MTEKESNLNSQQLIVHNPTNDDQIVELIVGINAPRMENENILFYLKFKDKSYSHCEWHNLGECKSYDGFISAFQQFSKFKQPFIRCSFVNDLYKPIEVLFNKEYLNPVKIITCKNNKYLVKWQNLPISDSTWETNVPQSLLVKFNEEKNQSVNVKFDLQRPIIPLNDNDINITISNSQDISIIPLMAIWNKFSGCFLTNWNDIDLSAIVLIFLKKLRHNSISGPFLFVLPITSISKWENYLKHYDIRYITLDGNVQHCSFIKQYCIFSSDDHSSIQVDAIILPLLFSNTDDIQFLSDITFSVIFFHLGFNSTPTIIQKYQKILRQFTLIFYFKQDESLIPFMINSPPPNFTLQDITFSPSQSKTATNQSTRIKIFFNDFPSENLIKQNSDTCIKISFSDNHLLKSHMESQDIQNSNTFETSDNSSDTILVKDNQNNKEGSSYEPENDLELSEDSKPKIQISKENKNEKSRTKKSSKKHQEALGYVNISDSSDERDNIQKNNRKTSSLESNYEKNNIKQSADQSDEELQSSKPKRTRRKKNKIEEKGSDKTENTEHKTIKSVSKVVSVPILTSKELTKSDVQKMFSFMSSYGICGTCARQDRNGIDWSEESRAFLLLAYMRIQDENKRNFLHDYVKKMIEEVQLENLKNLLQIQPLCDSVFIDSLFYSRKKSIEDSSLKFIKECRINDEIFRGIVYQNSIKFSNGWNFGKSMATSSFWNSNEDYSLLLFVIHYGFSSLKSPKFNREQYYQNALIFHHPKSIIPDRKWLKRRAQILSYEIGFSIPPDFKFQSKKIPDQLAFTQNFVPNNQQPLSKCDKKRILSVLYRYGIPEHNTIDEKAKIIQDITHLIDVNPDEISTFVTNIKTMCDQCESFIASSDINQTSDIYSTNDISLLREYDLSMIKKLNSMLKFHEKLRQTFSKYPRFHFTRNERWEKAPSWWNEKYDRILIQTTALFGFQSFIELVIRLSGELDSKVSAALHAELFTEKELGYPIHTSLTKDFDFLFDIEVRKKRIETLLDNLEETPIRFMNIQSQPSVMIGDHPMKQIGSIILNLPYNRLHFWVYEGSYDEKSEKCYAAQCQEIPEIYCCTENHNIFILKLNMVIKNYFRAHGFNRFPQFPLDIKLLDIINS